MIQTAVVYSGEARTFAKVFENQYFHVLRKLPNPEFFVSVQDDAQAPDMYRLLEKFPSDRVHIEFVQQPTLREPPADPQYLAMYPPSSPPQAILRQLWALDRAWDFFNSFLSAEDSHQVVRIRPDLAFYRFEMPRGMSNCVTPWWARWGGVNDRMAVMSRGAARSYFTTHMRVEGLRGLGCPLHPETLIAASLELGGITPSHTLATEFATVRLDGTLVAPSVSLIDQVEYSRTKPQP